MDKTNTSLTITCIKKVKAAFRCNTINGPDLIHVGPEPHVILYTWKPHVHTHCLSLSLCISLYIILLLYMHWKSLEFHLRNGEEEEEEKEEEAA